MIEINDITKKFENYTVLNSCSFKGENEIYGLLGKNGAGKTTLFKILLGLLTPSKGYVKICGKNSKEERQQVLRLVGATIEQPKFYSHLSAFENLSIHLSYMSFDDNEYKILIEEALSFVGLTNDIEKKVSKYSLGMKQRLAIARAIIHKPKVLILDEPMNGLDPIGIKDMRNLFKKLALEKSMTIFFSSHMLNEVMAVSDHILVLRDGKIVLEEEKEVIVSRYQEDVESFLIKCMEDSNYDAIN
ncbi:ABC transporter ATP-binding protein [Sporosarcina sp. FSL K6-3457]|uniref:ABC transporter ATP-binding protein n=1 Tax=Sporosarcina sp. FSL K6-3457 TaxID=2978204 RepID=UPI0030F7EF21